MRAERRHEIERQMESDRRQIRREKKKNRKYRFMAILFLIAEVLFTWNLLKMNVLPTKYVYILIAVLALVTLFIFPVMYSHKGIKSRKIISTVFALLLIVVFGLGTIYLSKTADFLDDIIVSHEERKIPTEDFYVVVNNDTMPPETNADGEPYKESEDESLARISGEIVGSYMTNDKAYAEAKAVLTEKVGVTYSYDDDVKVSLQKLINGEYKAVIVPAVSYSTIQYDESLDLTGTGILYTVKIPIEERSEEETTVNVTEESFNIYISGADEGGIRSDVNMVATVNPKKHTVLLTSIPRDYYITIPSKDAKDKLTHSRIYGIQETIGAVEDALGIDINYYVTVNYSSLKTIVDAIGGIDVESQYDFYTSGMGRLNGHHFVVGTNHLDGDAALAFCRERHSFQAGDMTRNENQQAVLKAILEKATSSTAILKSYTSILSAVSGNMETDMSQDDMAALIRMQLENMSGWSIKKQAIKGENDLQYCYALGYYASVVSQIPEENAKAYDEIIHIMMDE